MNILAQKQCTKCGKWKSLDNFRVMTKKRGYTFSMSHCKQCEREYTRQWEKNNPERHKENKKKWSAANREKENARAKAWHDAHPERRSEHARKYRLLHLEDVKRRIKDWEARHPEALITKIQNRRARREKNGGVITATEWRKLKEKYDYTCLCCGRREPEIVLTLDHVKPLFLGGKNVIENAQPLCQVCNSSKGIKEIDYR